MAVRAGPHHRCIDLQVLRHVGDVDHGAVDHMAGDAGFIADQCLADGGLDAVAADHRVAMVMLAVLVDHGHTLVVLQ
ncbi:hypothetical protein D3C72_2415670 [compost metagenome]